MITITKQITINPGVGDSGPYTYTWSAPGSAAGCVTFSNITGTITNPTTQDIITDITFANETCLDDATITLTITYNGGDCVFEQDITITNPCDDLTVSSITHTAPYTFSVAVGGGTSGYTYVWNYDASLFASSGNTNSNVLVLNYIGTGTPPTTTNIAVRVIDAAGCSELVSREITLCAPSVANYLVTTQCAASGSGYASSVGLCIVPTNCTGTALNWDTITFIPSAAGISVVQATTNTALCAGLGGRRYNIQVASGVTSGTYTIQYYISDINGAQSNTGTITITVPACVGNDLVIEAVAPFEIPCTAIVTDIYEIGPLTNYVSSTNPIDWTSLELINASSGATAGTGPLTTPLSGTVNFNTSTLMLEYEIPALTGTDSFQWTVCDTSGNCATSSIYAIVLDCPRVPTAVADAECGVCGEVEEHDVLTNDTINGVLVDLQVTSSASNGVAAFNNDFTSPRILYTANAGYSGSDSYDYTLTNDAGETDTATVTVTVICAGQDTSIAICE